MFSFYLFRQKYCSGVNNCWDWEFLLKRDKKSTNIFSTILEVFHLYIKTTTHAQKLHLSWLYCGTYIIAAKKCSRENGGIIWWYCKGKLNLLTLDEGPLRDNYAVMSKYTVQTFTMPLELPLHRKIYFHITMIYRMIYLNFT